MCGIFACTFTFEKLKCLERTLQLLRRRGPDSFRVTFQDGLLFAGSVLQTQGSKLATQPFVQNSNVLLYNGDMFMELPESSKSDTEWLAEQLQEAQDDNELCELVSRMTGPFSFVWYRAETRSLFFCRDFFGRNSLLISKIGDSKFLVSSVLDSSFTETHEIPALGLFKLDLNSGRFTLFSWHDLKKDEFYRNLFENFQTSLDCYFETLPNTRGALQRSELDFSFDALLDLGNESDEEIFGEAFKICQPAALRLLELLDASVKERVQVQVQRCKNCKRPCSHSKVSILFSGGLDCSLIAALAHKNTPSGEPIDLINVAFERVDAKAPDFDVPDRITGRQSHQELTSVFPSRPWNFVEVNVTRLELDRVLKEELRDLVNPLKTVLDESMSAAFWFASRGKGSSARTVLYGAGADELFGGYSRHRNAFRRGGWEALSEELLLDWKRLPFRNLARDDRMVAAHEVVPRTPYLQEGFVEFVQGLRPEQRTCPRLRLGVGDKILLRAAAFSLGLRRSCTYPKRAFQFGSRVANKKQNAADFSEYFKNLKTNS